MVLMMSGLLTAVAGCVSTTEQSRFHKADNKPPATSLGMVNQGIYGAGIAGDTKANTIVGPAGQRMAIRFKATTTSPLRSMRFVQRGGPGYSAGTGGTLTVSVQPDSGRGNPSGIKLAQRSYSAGNPAGSWEKYDKVTFPAPPTLKAGTIYYLVIENASTSNYISVNSMYVYDRPLSPRQAAFSDAEYGLLHTKGAWGDVDARYTPVVELAYANGVRDGQSYYEAMIDHYGTISGERRMVRENFAVSGGDRAVQSASVRVRRSSGTSPLTMTLETSAGVVLESVEVPAANVPVSAPGGDNGGAVWVTARFPSPHFLSNGERYNLRLSTEADTTYTTFPLRSGVDKGLSSYRFSGGRAQSTTDGSRWDDLYPHSQQNLQFYLRLTQL